MLWTDDATIALKRMWGEGTYASAIAKELGVSRNAVIGKANRLGLEKRKETPRGKPPSDRPMSQKALERRRSNLLPRKPRQPRSTKPGAKPPKAEIVHMLDNAIPLEQRRTLWTIKDNECHFPVGHPDEPSFFYCGAPKHGERPYCQTHQQRMFTPARPRTPRGEKAKPLMPFHISQRLGRTFG